MANLELPYRIKLVNKSAQADADFGVYESVEAANTAIPAALRIVGKLVGIYADGKLILHAYQGGIADADLKPLGGGVEMNGTFMQGTQLNGTYN